MLDGALRVSWGCVAENKLQAIHSIPDLPMTIAFPML